MVKITVSASARIDLKEIIDYIKKGSKYYANIEKAKIINAINKIPLQVYAGRIVPELAINNIREVIFGNYRIIYDIISEQQINIVAIHHHSRNLSNNPAVKSDE